MRTNESRNGDGAPDGPQVANCIADGKYNFGTELERDRGWERECVRESLCVWERVSVCDAEARPSVQSDSSGDGALRSTCSENFP
jgi:hypothetical protein